MRKIPLVSIIFPAKNEGNNVHSTLDSLFESKTEYNFEVIIVNDGSTDHCCDFLKGYREKEKILLINTTGIGAASARNLGAKNSSGKYLIFCDAHLSFEDWWIDYLLEPLINNETDVTTPGIASAENPTVIGYGQTLTTTLKAKWNPKQNNLFETAIVPGGCFAVKKSTFHEIGGFEGGFTKSGNEDIEFSIRLWLFGYRCHVQPKVKILHLFRISHPYLVTSEDFKYNLLRMAYLHFNPKRIQKCKNMIRQKKARNIESVMIKNGVLDIRNHFFLSENMRMIGFLKSLIFIFNDQRYFLHYKLIQNII